jgi:putative IMPACT (imprinted ancient) family translation regulator
MAKTYRRTDGFEVQDLLDRPIEWVVKTYGGEFVEIITTPPTAEELAAKAEIAESKDYLAKTDYKILKKLEALLPADDVDVIARKAKRGRINTLEVAENEAVALRAELNG